MAKLGFAFGALMCLMVLLEEGDGTEFTVGGAQGWAVPMAQTYNQWAEANRFQMGDSLVFKYAADQDSVLQVTQDDYNSCSIQSPIKQYSDGHTVFQFDKSGPYFFISGNKDSCLQNEKLVVVVLADRSNSTSNQTITLPPSPAPANDQTGMEEPSPSPAPANDQTGTASPPPSRSEINPSPPPTEQVNPSSPPAAEVNPSPAPTGEESPPAGTVEINPMPPSALVQPPRSVGASIIPSSIGSIGAFVAVAILAFF